MADGKWRATAGGNVSTAILRAESALLERQFDRKRAALAGLAGEFDCGVLLVGGLCDMVAR
jgi:hypothetical protein